MYVVLALFMLMDIVQKPTLRSYLKKILFWQPPVLGSVISMGLFESSCKCMHFNNNASKDTSLGPPRLFKIYPVMSYVKR
jgi:hypothetical protein